MLRRCLLLAAAATSFAAAAAPDRKSEHEALKARIETLRKDLSRTEESRSEAADELQEAEAAISAARRRLRELGESRAAAQAQLAALQTQVRAIERNIGAHQERLAALLRNRYQAGEGDALRHLLGGANPNAIGRDAWYLRSLARAQADLIADLRQQLAQREILAAGLEDKRAELARLAGEQEGEQRRLQEQRESRNKTLATLSERLRAQRRDLSSLQRDEKRLARLIDGLNRLVKKRAKARSAPPPASAPAARPDAPAAPAANAPAEEDPPGMADTGFARLKGRLPWPLRGELAGRYGGARATAGGTWKGMFIRAAEGAEVRAVAAGKVVFADWLRGFGNLLIVDHGGDYLTVYGFNETLLKGVGQNVRGGELIATAGASGGAADSGVYFEIRFQGQPLDPAKWVNAR